MANHLGLSAYQSLIDYLASRSENELTLSFPEFEGILGWSLPQWAHTSAWWSNTTRTPQGRAWQVAGWRVQKLQVRVRRVTFRRQAGALG